jgi:hypothetical protein
MKDFQESLNFAKEQKAIKRIFMVEIFTLDLDVIMHKKRKNNWKSNIAHKGSLFG